MNDGLVIVRDAEKRRIWVSLKVYLIFNAGKRSPCSIALFLPNQSPPSEAYLTHCRAYSYLSPRLMRRFSVG